MIVVAFDIGVKNFAFAIMEDDNVMYLDVHDLRDGNPYHNLITYMKQFDHLWKKVDVILIEQQLNRMNIQATKLACHLYAFFLHRHPDTCLFEYPSIYKTKYTDFSHKSSSHKERKQHAIQHVLGEFQEKDPVLFQWISSFRKKDDICDCILMIQTFPLTPLYRTYLHGKTDFQKAMCTQL